MAAEPQRKPDPSKYLDASLVPLERALRARADALLTVADDMAGVAPDDPKAELTSITAVITAAIAIQFRQLADELYHW